MSKALSQIEKLNPSFVQAAIASLIIKDGYDDIAATVFPEHRKSSKLSELQELPEIAGLSRSRNWDEYSYASGAKEWVSRPALLTHRVRSGGDRGGPPKPRHRHGVRDHSLFKNVVQHLGEVAGRMYASGFRGTPAGTPGFCVSGCHHGPVQRMSGIAPFISPA